MSNKCKVLMLAPDINSQGGISSVVRLYKDYGLDINILSTYKGGNMFTKLVAFFIFLFKYIFVLSFNKNIQIVHIHTASKGSFLRKATAFKIAKLFRKKVIFNIHPTWFTTFYEISNNFVKNLITDTLNRSDLILVLSEVIKVNVKNICQNDNIKILYNPVVIKEIVYRQSEKLNVLFLGKLCEAKGVYDIIKAAKIIKSYNVEINLYGDGNINEFRKLIDENNLGEKVKIRGWISGDEKDRALKDSDIYILPSYSEGLPMSILEAMAIGLPVISTPVGGTPEAVEDGVNGFLVEVGDYAGLAQKIDLLAGDNALREEMGKQGYRIAKEKFDVKIIIKQLQEIYDKLLG